MMQNHTLQQIADIQQIRNCLALHSRGVDRADAGMISNAYHPDATVSYGFFDGPASELASILAEAQTGQPITLHRTAQSWMRLDGDIARVESYIMAYAQVPDADGNPVQRLICGRYLDRMSRRNGVWRIAHRGYVLDTNVNWSGHFPGILVTPIDSYLPTGGQGSADPGLALLAHAQAANQTTSDQEEDARMSSVNTDTTTIDTILSRQQICDLTAAYCRGVDRADPALLKSLFHDDATVVTGTFNGNGAQFAAEITRMVKAGFDQTFHSVANQ